MRVSTCEKLFKRLEQTGYYIMEGGPGMGKTSLLQCLLEWAANNHPDMHTVYINLKREKSNFKLEDVLQAHLGCPLDDVMWGGYTPSAVDLVVHWSPHISSPSYQTALPVTATVSVFASLHSLYMPMLHVPCL